MCFRPPEFNKLMTRCPACNLFNPPDAKKCKKCGADLPEPKPADTDDNKAGPNMSNARHIAPKKNNPQK